MDIMINENETFFESVYEVVSHIPYGSVISYGEIARYLGYPRMARQVGRAMRNCPDKLPWHRVVMSNGTIAGGSYADIRREMLKLEGVPFTSDDCVDIKKCKWHFDKS